MYYSEETGEERDYYLLSWEKKEETLTLLTLSCNTTAEFRILRMQREFSRYEVIYYTPDNRCNDSRRCGFRHSISNRPTSICRIADFAKRHVWILHTLCNARE